MTPEEVKAAIDRLPKHVAKKLNEVINKVNEENSLLPTISAEDNDKVLTAENGKWILKHILAKETLPYFFIGKSGKIDDDAIYQKILKDKLNLFYVTDGDSLVLLTPSGLQDDGKILLLKGMLLSKKDHSATLYQIALSPDESWTLTEYKIGETGANGKSAYEIALEYGFEGSEEKWLDSLKADCAILENTSSADNGKVLGVENGNAKWVNIDTDPLPSVTMNDDGKYLLVEDGEWVAKHFSHSGEYMLEGTSGALIRDEETFTRIVRGEMPLKLVAKSGNIVELFPVSKSGSWDTYRFFGTETDEENNTLVGYLVTVLDADLSWRLTTYPFPLNMKQTLEQHDNDIADLKDKDEEIAAMIGEILANPPSQGTTSVARQYVTLRGGSEGMFGTDELSILRSDENGIEYVIEESTNSSRIYHCHLSENTKTRKTYVSRTFTGQNGSASYIIIRVDLSGNWYKTESTYKGFLTPTAADSGKVLTVHANGTPIWSDPINSYTLTPTDKADIAEMVDGATIVQAPKYVNSVSEMTDTNRLYVLASTGKIWAYMNTSVEQEVTKTFNVVGESGNDFVAGSRFSSSTSGDTFTNDVSQCHLTPLIDLTKAGYQGKTIQIHLNSKGAGVQYASTGTYTNYVQCRIYGTDKTILAARPYVVDVGIGGSGLVEICNSTISVAYHSNTSATVTITMPPTYGSAKTTIGYIRFCGVGAIADSNVYITYPDTQTVTGSQWVDTGRIYAPVLSNEDKQDIIDQVIESIDTELLSVVGSGDV